MPTDMSKNPAEKLYFSVIKKDREGAVLRNTRTRIERRFGWNDINCYFKKSGSDWLYEIDENSKYFDEVEELSLHMREEIVQIMTTYLLARNGNTMYLLAFGGMVRDFMDKYSLSLADFIQLFQGYHKMMFGTIPTMDPKQILTLQVE